MTDMVREMKEAWDMGDTERQVRYGIGAAAAAAAIYAPLGYAAKGILTAVAAEAILTGIYGVSPFHYIKKQFS